MATAMIPPRRVFAVFSQMLGTRRWVREPFNVLKWGGQGRPIRTFLEPAGPLLKTPASNTEEYDDVRMYDHPPFPKSGV